eukprot:10089706-Alexandrium_andersonii.AAC.1
MRAGRPPYFPRRTWWSVSKARIQSTDAACSTRNRRSKSVTGMLPVGWAIGADGLSVELAAAVLA